MGKCGGINEYNLKNLTKISERDNLDPKNGFLVPNF